MNRLIICLTTFCISMATFADRYGVYDEDSLGSSSNFFNVVLAVLFSIAALLYLGYSFLEWKERHAKGEKPKAKDGLGDLLFTLAGYAVIAAYACMPFLFLLKLFYDASFIRENWYLVFFACFALIIYFRRT